MKYVVVGTAGHIDHGKTALVKALTGTDCDRLPEEQERGITIDLGFAFLSPAADLQLGIVDVPGHERFVKNMVAGTGGMDLVMLVVAADEGVMPQTREHLDICGLLGLRRGLVVVTKRDLVDDEWAALVRDDLAFFLEGSFLEDAPVIEFSATDGRGQDEVQQALVRLAREVADRPLGGAPRLPIDRVFTLSGFGTVVTGTLLSGMLHPGDPLETVPSGARARIRGLHAYGHETQEARAGMRTAVNLQGVERAAIQRGDVLTRPDALRATRTLDVELHYLPVARRPLGRRSLLLFHVGTAQAQGTVRILGRTELAPGESSVVQVQLDRPLAAMPGDRFIVRGFETLEHYGQTVGGGVILDAHAPRHRRRQTESALEALQTLRDGTPGEKIETLLRRAGPRGLDPAELARRLPLSAKEIERNLVDLLSRQVALRFDRERGTCVHQDVADSLRAQTLGLIAGYHEQHPERPGIPKEELRSRLAPEFDPKLFHLVLGQLEDQIVVAQDTVRVAAHQQVLSADDSDREEGVLAGYRKAGLAPPRPKEVAATLELSEAEVHRVARFLASRGDLIRVNDELYFDRQAVDELRARLVAFLKESGEITTQQFKEMTGLTRKHLIPLQEYFDSRKLTLRISDTTRVLRVGAGG